MTLIFEKRIKNEELPYFINLKAHLASKKIPCPHPIANSNGCLINKIKDLKTDTKETVTEVDYVARICRLLSNVPEHLDKGIVHKEVHNFLMGV